MTTEEKFFFGFFGYNGIYKRADRIDDFEIRLEKDTIIVSKHNILWKLN